jgi:hypothetical protein
VCLRLLERCRAISMTKMKSTINHFQVQKRQQQWCEQQGEVACKGVVTSQGLTQHERSVALLYPLIPCFPINLYLLIPRNFDEAQKRSDSLCIMLGLPFSALGPVLYSASMLKSRHRSLLYCERGYNALNSTYKNYNLNVGTVQIEGEKLLFCLWQRRVEEASVHSCF